MPSPSTGSVSLLSIEYEVFPGQSLGPFLLGLSLWKVLEYLRENKVSYPQVKVTYDTDNPNVSPIVVRVLPCLDLIFSGYSQRLRSISLRQPNSNSVGMPALILRYKNVVLAAPNHPMRKAGVVNTFGPTYSGDIIRYPGIIFSCLDDGNEIGKRQQRKPVDSTALEIQKIVIQPIEATEADESIREIIEYPIMIGDISHVIAEVNKGTRIFLYPSSTAPIFIPLGASAEDLECDLGSPLRRFYKEDSRLDIHASSIPVTEHHKEENDYFYNYFQYGIDFLVSGVTHKVKKIILHSNIPGSPSFQRYARCPWTLRVGSDSTSSVTWLFVHAYTDMTYYKVEFTDKVDDLLKLLNPTSSEPPPFMELHQIEDERLSSSGFKTRLIGFEGIVAESYGNQISTLTLTRIA